MFKEHDEQENTSICSDEEMEREGSEGKLAEEESFETLGDAEVVALVEKEVLDNIDRIGLEDASAAMPIENDERVAAEGISLPIRAKDDGPRIAST